jgi:DNA-binding NtrC family response regulator
MRCVLVLCRDRNLLYTREQILQRAGYCTISGSDLSKGLRIAQERQPALVLVGASFTEAAQMLFVEQLHETYPEIRVLLLRHGFIDPLEMLEMCRSFLDCGPGESRVRILD